MTKTEGPFLTDSRIDHTKDLFGGGICPVQATGFLVDGRPFYFRFRSGYASLQVEPVGSKNLPNRNPEWNSQDYDRANSLQEEYPIPYWAGVRADLDICSKDDPYRGYFFTEDEKNNTFAALLNMILEAESELS